MSRRRLHQAGLGEPRISGRRSCDHRGEHVQHTSAAFWIKGVAVFPRHLLAQTLGRPVFSVPVLVVVLLGARGPGIPWNSRVRVPRERLQSYREGAGVARGLEKNSGVAVGGIDNASGDRRETRQVISRPSSLNWQRGHCLIPARACYCNPLVIYSRRCNFDP